MIRESIIFSLAFLLITSVIQQEKNLVCQVIFYPDLDCLIRKQSDRQ